MLMPRTLRPRRLAFAAFLFAAVAGTVQAQGVSASGAFDKFMWTATGGSAQTVGYSSTGQPVLTPGVPSIDTDGGMPRVSNTGSLSNPSGRLVPIAATGRIPAAEVGRAVGRALAKVAGPLAVGIAVYDLAKELGFDLSRDASGGVSVSKADPSVCTAAPCVQWRMTTIDAWQNSGEAACRAYVGRLGGSNVYKNTTYAYGVPDTCVWTYNAARTAEASRDGFTSQTVSPSPSSFTPSSEQEFLDAVAAKSGWPSTSNVSKVLAQSTVVQVGPLTVTGPSSSVGGQRVTANATNNTTNTQTTTYNHTYEGAKVTTNTSTTSVTVNNSTGATTSQETTTGEEAPKVEPVEIETCGLPGKPKCLIDETGTPEAVPADKYKPVLDDYKVKAAELTSTVSGAADKGFFSGWSSVFVTPPLAACAPFVLPRDMGSLDPCPVVDGVRSIMAYIWAVTALWLSLGMIRRVI